MRLAAPKRATLTAPAKARGPALARALAAVLAPLQRSQLVARRPGFVEAPCRWRSSIELSQKVSDDLLGYLATRSVTVRADQGSQAENNLEALVR